MAECGCRAEVAIDYNGPPWKALASDVKVRITGIIYCSTHAAAFRLADALTASMPLYDLGVDAATEGERSLENKRAAQAIIARNRALLREIGRG